MLNKKKRTAVISPAFTCSFAKLHFIFNQLQFAITQKFQIVSLVMDATPVALAYPQFIAESPPLSSLLLALTLY